jgi:serine/threonine protein kinase
MAPEQIDGGPVDQRTDIYALGITAFEMVTGRRPFPEDNAKALLDTHLTRDVTDPGHIIPDIPDELREFILQSARCDPDQRFQDMDQAMAVLRPLAQDIRLPRDGLSIEEKKRASLFLTYKDENQPALKRLLDVFKANAQELGVDVKMIDNQDL